MSFCIIFYLVGWVCFSIGLIDGSYVSTLDEHQCLILFFPAVTQSLFQRDMNFARAVSSHLRLPVTQHRADEKLEAFFFFSAMMRRKSKILILPPFSFSHVQASICVSRSNVIIPFCSGCCHGVVPPPLAWRLPYSNFTAQLTPQSAAWKSSNICNLETQQTARLSGSNGLKMFAFMTHIAVTVRLGGKYLHE